MRIVSVVGGFGPGGLTAAVLNRAALLERIGYDASVVTLNFNAHFDDTRAKLIADGRLSPRIPIINPYASMATSYARKTGYVSALAGSGDLTFGKAKVSEDGLSREYGFTAAGERVLRVVRDPAASAVIKVDCFDTQGIIVRREIHAHGHVALVTDFFQGDRISERFLSPGGFCYVRKEYDAQPQRLKHLWSWNGKRKGPVQYADEGAWQRMFLKRLAKESDGMTIFLIDADTVSYDYLRLASDEVRVVPVVHASHAAPGTPGAADIGSSFARLSEFPAVVFLTSRQAHDVAALAPEGFQPTVIANYVPTVDDPVQGSGDAPGNRDVVLMGRLVPSKRVDDALRAFALVIAKVPEARLRIFGRGPEQASLEALASELGIESHVTFCGYTTTPVERLADSRVSILTSEQEGFGLVIAESMAVGTPVVAMDCDYGPRDLIVDGVTGFIIPDRDIVAFADRICDILTDDDLHRRLATQGRQRAAESLSGQHLAAQWGALFTSLT